MQPKDYVADLINHHPSPARSPSTSGGSPAHGSINEGVTNGSTILWELPTFASPDVMARYSRSGLHQGDAMLKQRPLLRHALHHGSSSLPSS